MKYVEKYRLDHAGFWLITTFFYAYLNWQLLPSMGTARFLADVVIRNAFLMATCYVNIYVLFERFFRSRRMFVYIIAVICLLCSWAFVQGFADVYLKQQDPAGNASGRAHNFYYNFSIGFFYVAFTLSLELSKRWYRQTLLLHQARNEKLTAELQYLRAQINPHFLFNSLNTIYFQIDKSNPGARESVQQFSELLRYQLYDCNEEMIPIEKEVSYLQSYVDLQRTRRSDGYTIDFQAGQSVNGFSIAPLLLLPFVENAFKHLSAFANGLNLVRISICRRDDRLVFRVVNTMDIQKRSTPGSSGIGLKNVQRRLDLLYPGRYDLLVDQDETRYSVQLQLHL